MIIKYQEDLEGKSATHVTWSRPLWSPLLAASILGVNEASGFIPGYYYYNHLAAKEAPTVHVCVCSNNNAM